MQRLLLALGLALGFALGPAIAFGAVNINTATMDELVALPGIGPAKAQAILDHRKAHGPFKSVEELKDVKGIGAKRFERLKPDLAVSGPSTAKSAAKPDAKPAAPSRTAKGEVATATVNRDGAGAATKP